MRRRSTRKHEWNPMSLGGCVLWLPFYKYGKEASKIWDQSDNHNDGIINGAVPYAGNPQMTSIGSTYNYGDFTSGNAFFWSSLDLSALAGTDLGYTPHYIEVLDAAGKKATGYLAGVGAGETLGSEIITNAADREFSSDTGFWVKDAGCTIAVGVAHFVAVAVNYGLNQNAALLTYLALYKGILTVSNHVAGNLDISSLTRVSLSTGNGLKTGYIIGSSNGRFYIIAGTIASLDADDVSFKRVTDPPATAVHIVSALNGTTRNWASVESGFNPNTITSWRIDKVRPKVGIGWYFDGVDDYVNCGANASLTIGISDLTILVWVRPSGYPSTLHRLVTKRDGAAWYSLYLISSLAYFQLEIAAGVGVTNNTPITMNKFSLLGATRNYSGNLCSAYTNGSLDGSSAAGNIDLTNAATLEIGSWASQAGQYLIGEIGEVLIFNRALSAHEIKSYYDKTRHIFGV